MLSPKSTRKRQAEHTTSKDSKETMTRIVEPKPNISDVEDKICGYDDESNSEDDDEAISALTQRQRLALTLKNQICYIFIYIYFYIYIYVYTQ